MKKIQTGMILLALTVTSKRKPFQGESKFIGEGEHVVTIKEMSENLAKACPQWKDRTPQIDVEFEDADGKTLKMWLNLKGYHSKKDEENGFVLPKNAEYRSSEGNREEYAVDKKTGNRIVSAEKTEKCMEILADFVRNAGIEEGAEIEVSDLVGNEIGIGVKLNAKNQSFVNYTKLASDVETAGE